MKTSVSGARKRRLRVDRRLIEKNKKTLRFQEHPKNNVWTGPKIKWFFLTCTGITTLWTALISFETLTIRYIPASSETMA